MEPQIIGQIQFEKVPASRGLRRFAEKQIRGWIQKRFGTSSKNHASYIVRVWREGSARVFNCQIQIRLGSQIWIGHNYEGGIHQALIQCLSRQMIPVPA